MAVVRAAVSVLLMAVCAQAGIVNEKVGLDEMFHTMKEEEWATSSGWGGDEVCSYAGVTCTQTCTLGLEDPDCLEPETVTELTLRSNWIDGELPMGIQKLSNLHTLQLPDNYIIGTIPEEIGHLTKLSILN